MTYIYIHTNYINKVIVLVSSTSFKEQSASVTSVKNILENHASDLMSGKELPKLVAFVKGTQFDLVVRKSCGLTHSKPNSHFSPWPKKKGFFVIVLLISLLWLSCSVTINCRSIFNVKDMEVLVWRILLQG